MVVMIMMISVVGASSGQITIRKICQRDAPSSRAACS